MAERDIDPGGEEGGGGEESRSEKPQDQRPQNLEPPSDKVTSYPSWDTIAVWPFYKAPYGLRPLLIGTLCGLSVYTTTVVASSLLHDVVVEEAEHLIGTE